MFADARFADGCEESKKVVFLITQDFYLTQPQLVGVATPGGRRYPLWGVATPFVWVPLVWLCFMCRCVLGVA